MTSAELLAAAEKANPELIEKTAKAFVVLEQWAPEFASELAADIDSITTVTLEKTADAVDQVGMAALGLGGAVVSGLAGSVAGDIYDAAKRGLTKGTNLKRIMVFNPELQRKDRKVLIDSFNTLHRYAPDFTSDPMLGGQILNQMCDIPDNHLVIIKDLLSSRKTLIDAKKSQFSLGKGGGGKGRG